jgi:excisionase family DNA binding protein
MKGQVRMKNEEVGAHPHPQPLSQPMGEGGVGLSPAQVNSQCAAPHPASGHLLPKAEKEFSSEEGFITKEVVAERLSVTPETVRRWASAGKLPSHHFGRRLRFKWSEVRAALANMDKGDQ